MNSNEISKIIKDRLDKRHIACFGGLDKPMLLISDEYHGVWLEHVYDAVFYAMLDKEKLYLAENTVEAFIDNQSADGQIPCFIRAESDTGKAGCFVGYSQIQECVSFPKLAFTVYRMNGKRDFLEKIYHSAKKWVLWLENNRMTLGHGMVEMFVGFDTGHDFSGRLEGLSRKGNYILNGVRQNAAVLPPEETVAPILAVDMNCNLYATLSTLSEMAKELELYAEAENWAKRAKELKNKIFEFLLDKEDCFFYDVDKNLNKRKYLSSTIFHLFMEGVLDKNDDKELIDELYTRHISNKDEFATPYPYPSMAVCDPSCKNKTEGNCWGYYSQGLIALRTTLWMEKYGFEKEFKNLCEKWVDAWTKHFDYIKLGQELDPISGVPTKCSEWYSSTMLFYLYAAGRISD